MTITVDSDPDRRATLTPDSDIHERERRSISVHGIVQGVGFRPFVYSLARREELVGWVRNDADGVYMEVEGSPGALKRLTSALQHESPPLARVDSINWEPMPLGGERVFSIEPSRGSSQRRALISPDVATCDDCLRELFDPADRRYRYPFINCTNCGPRFTIIQSIPYDRPATTMAAFTMCPECRREYQDPLNRRFHAQPNACPECGPRTHLLDHAGRDLTEGDAVAQAADLIRGGAIVAIKGIGGYHLACDPFSQAAV
ncbi:MAG: acylphosphatase, partial [Chloroflexota bacterium]